MEVKKWYQSKTIWVNIILLAGLFSQSLVGLDLSAEEQGSIIVLINLILRIITKQPLGK